MIKYLIAVLCICVSCQQNKVVPVPDTRWDLFDSSSGISLNESMRNKLEGVYAITEGDQAFGDLAALKWSYTVSRQDTTFHLSIFCEKDKAYFICEGKRLDTMILLNGYWRKMANDETGKARFKISSDRAMNQVMDSTKSEVDNILIEGIYGNNEKTPDTRLTLKYLRKLNKNKAMEIIAHRGGGRNTDFLPASENSIELIRMSSRFGATGVEIDIQLTKDGTPVLYHDANINDRLTNKAGVRGNIDDYTYQELNSKIRLKKGERIPSLREALETIVHQTPLQFVWLDVKDKNALQKTIELQHEFMQAASSGGRKVELIIGIHDEEVFKKFLLIPDYKSIPSLCEISPEHTTMINARIWAPVWAKGLQKLEVTTMHAQSRKVIVWTMDKPKKIHEFITEGDFDGIVSNFPSLVAYYYYTKE